jgi:hypothetical protein
VPRKGRVRSKGRYILALGDASRGLTPAERVLDGVSGHLDAVAGARDSISIGFVGGNEDRGALHDTRGAGVVGAHHDRSAG